MEKKGINISMKVNFMLNGKLVCGFMITRERVEVVEGDGHVELARERLRILRRLLQFIKKATI